MATVGSAVVLTAISASRKRRVKVTRWHARRNIRPDLVTLSVAWRTSRAKQPSLAFTVLAF
jgi:hypothetical protein